MLHEVRCGHHDVMLQRTLEAFGVYFSSRLRGIAIAHSRSFAKFNGVSRQLQVLPLQMSGIGHSFLVRFFLGAWASTARVVWPSPTGRWPILR